ncbi:phage virion morphogenesis protein [Campylobacter sp. faydin G-24]|uniref:Phage virion morphogenesis protein n=1 Tax=Campylobacter anatolicus TaxID=2829105 RepID=A0ABS5HH90_9BACT|nr:phage virion morphogenesis protein [Campylobacter anatolicus]MBR8463646.1 phage virion morphogenesis protein [Campylobacter anatolicus]
MIEIKGLQKVEAKLKVLSDLSTNTKPLMQTLGTILQNEIEDSFENETSPFGQRWKTLSQSTLKNKLKKGKSERILRYDGNLADRWLLKTTNTKASVSNNASHKGFAYGLVHQFGTAKAGRNRNAKISARPFLPVDKSGKLAKDVKREIKAEIISFIKNI